MIHLKPLNRQDYKALFEFEKENRLFFEGFVPSRGEDYFSWSVFCQKNDELLQEQARKKSFFFLIKDEKELILGRLNLVDLDFKEKHGTIGYRIGEPYNGRGIAQQALRQLLSSAYLLGLNQLKAQTTTDNFASQKVLLNQQFRVREKEPESFRLNKEEKSFIYYQLDLKGKNGFVN